MKWNDVHKRSALGTQFSDKQNEMHRSHCIFWCAHLNCTILVVSSTPYSVHTTHNILSCEKVIFLHNSLNRINIFHQLVCCWHRQTEMRWDFKPSSRWYNRKCDQRNNFSTCEKCTHTQLAWNNRLFEIVHNATKKIELQRTKKQNERQRNHTKKKRIKYGKIYHEKQITLKKRANINQTKKSVAWKPYP